MLFDLRDWAWDDFAAWGALCALVGYMALSLACA